jgi:hypothetical protein
LVEQLLNHRHFQAHGTGRPDLRFHDLRHTGQTLAAAAGANLRELMARAGQSSPGAALRYLHEVRVPHVPIVRARHGWAELLTLVGAVRRLAYDRTLAPDDAMRRIRDAFDVYDGRADGEGSSQ